MLETNPDQLPDAISKMENAILDTEASGRPAAHLYGVWQNTKHAIFVLLSDRVERDSVLEEAARLCENSGIVHRTFDEQEAALDMARQLASAIRRIKRSK